jgi:hypothetical protein
LRNDRWTLAASRPLPTVVVKTNPVSTHFPPALARSVSCTALSRCSAAHRPAERICRAFVGRAWSSCPSTAAPNARQRFKQFRCVDRHVPSAAPASPRRGCRSAARPRCRRRSGASWSGPIFYGTRSRDARRERVPQLARRSALRANVGDKSKCAPNSPSQSWRQACCKR